MSTEVKATGPLFQGRINIRQGTRDGLEQIAAEGARLMRGELGRRTRYRTDKYGHVADAVRTQVKDLPEGIGARMFLAGQSFFVGRLLEGGAVGHFIAPKFRRRRGMGRRQGVLAYRLGGQLLFRAYAHHPGTPAYHWRAQAEAALEPRVQPIMDAAFEKALHGG
jgi:hypothetical protein